MKYTIQRHPTNQTYRIILVKELSFKKVITDYMFENKQDAYNYITSLGEINNEEKARIITTT